MTYEEFSNYFLNELSDKYDSRELNNMMRVYCEDKLLEFPIDINDVELITKDIYNLKRDIPLQYVVNNARFYDLDIKLNSNVLIPRPETEEMVFYIKENCAIDEAVAIDIGTGSGCIALLLKNLFPSWEIDAVDVSQEALSVAVENSDQLKIDISVKHMNILEPAEWGSRTYDIIVSNPPYITRAELHRMSQSTVEYEPEIALFVPQDNPLLFYEKITHFANKNLSPSGHLIVEINDIYAEETRELMSSILQSHNFQVVKDMQGKERFIHGRPRSENQEF